MKLVIVSTFWNANKYVQECIKSLKEQYFTNFVAYFIDDMSSDESYEIAKKTIDDDERFILIKNNYKKFKTKNFLDVIKNNEKINWDDVIIELDGDDKLADNFVLGRINKVFSDDNIWLCGTRWKDRSGRLGNYGKPNLQKVRSTVWNFSHMRSYRAFLFRQIQDEHLKFEGEYFKASCDIGFALPMMEMAGEEHFHYINEALYVYTWHQNQSYTEKNSFNDSKLQSRIGSYIYRNLPPYSKLNLIIPEFLDDELPHIENKKDNSDLLNKLFGSNPRTKETKTIDYDKINQIIINQTIYKSKPNEGRVQQNIPNDRNHLVEIRKNSLTQLARDISGVKPNRKKNLLNIFSNKSK